MVLIKLGHYIYCNNINHGVEFKIVQFSSVNKNAIFSTPNGITIKTLLASSCNLSLLSAQIKNSSVIFTIQKIFNVNRSRPKLKYVNNK